MAAKKNIDENVDVVEETKEVVKTATVNSPTGLNFRKKPEVGDNIISILDANETVTVKDVKGDWTAIEHNNKKGYVMTKFLTIE